MNKKIICILALLSLLTGCTVNNDKVNDDEINNNDSEISMEENIQVQEEEPEIITQFTALGNTYESTKDIMQLNEGDMIYDRLGENPHIRGEYKEVDFALDLLTEYLFKNPDVYNYIISEWNNNSDEVQLISGEEKQRAIDEANFLSEQFMLSDEDPVYFKLDKVIVQEKLEEDNAVVIELRGHLSATDGNFRPLGTFTVTVYNKGDKLYGTIL